MKKTILFLFFTLGLFSCDALLPEPEVNKFSFTYSWSKSTLYQMNIYLTNKHYQQVQSVDFYILLKDGETIKDKKRYYRVGPILPNEQFKLEGITDCAFAVTPTQYQEYQNYKPVFQLESVTWK